jgi:GntR family transcriptional repressor for pyruvate dehydrogenase complex
METQLKAIKRRRLFQDVVQQIRELILNQRLALGHRLPPERELAEQFQVSRSSLREAMRTLELQGLVTIRPGAGTFVHAQGEESMSEALVSYLTNGDGALRDVFELRHILEPQMAALAAQRATPEDVGRMEEMLGEQSDQIARGETGAQGDTAFHFAVAQATHNSALVKVVTAMGDILSQSREQPLQAPGRPQRSVASHRYILEMIREGDGQGAREAMEHHISVVEPFTSPTEASRSTEKGVPMNHQGAQGEVVS